MKNSNNHTSTQLTPGFEVVQNEENGMYYFRCNDLNGNPILSSKDYPTQKNAQNSLNNARRFAKQVRNYARKTQGKQHYFLLETSNHHELAKSILFDNEKELQNAIDYLLQVLASPKIAEEKTPGVKPYEDTSLERMTSKLTTENTKPKNQQKYSFKIDLYQRGGNQLSGKIEYLLNQESTTFKGVDTQAIALFIDQHLCLQPPINTPKTSTVTNQVDSSLMELSLLSGSNGSPIRFLHAGQPTLYFLLQDRKKGELLKDSIQQVKIAARTLDRTIVNTFESKIEPFEKGKAQLALPGIYFPKGIYRIQVTHTGKETSLDKHRNMEASCVFQIF